MIPSSARREGEKERKINDKDNQHVNQKNNPFIIGDVNKRRMRGHDCHHIIDRIVSPSVLPRTYDPLGNTVRRLRSNGGSKTISVI